MGQAAGGEPTLEDVVTEIRRVRLKRFFSLTDIELCALSSQHESMLHFLYEIYRRYGESMDERMKTAVVIYLLSRDANFEIVYRSLEKDASNKGVVLNKFAKTEREQIGACN
ncbi:MAG: hypothetical protein V1909_04310 [Candidatus Micrarchaeota archaeon]